MFGKRIPPEESITSRVRAATGRTQVVEGPADVPEAADKRADPEPSSFEVRPPRYQFADLVLPASTRDEYAVLLSRIRNHDVIYDAWGLAAVDPVGRSRAVNFFGPPGTGKTMCAEALAAELGYGVLDVNYAEIESKYVGETPKKIRSAFRAAEAAPGGAVLLFDEADAILGRRMTNVTQAADHSVNVSRAVMLKELEQFAGVVVFATNLAKNFDGAFVRRIMQHVSVPLPDADNRRLLWDRMIPPPVPGRDALDWAALAERSAGLAGGEIRNAVVLALAKAADRTGPDRVVRTDDLLAAADGVLRAKREVGRYDYDRPLTDGEV